MEQVFAEVTLAPVVDPVWILGASCVVIALAGVGVWRRVRGMAGRIVAAVILLLALVDPRVQVDERELLQDVVYLVVDESGSQEIAGREKQTATAALEFERQLRDAGAEPRVVRVGDGGASPVLQALRGAVQEVAEERVSGAVLITDGLVDDAEALPEFPGPVHALITGDDREFDRRIRLLRAPTFGIVRQEAEVELLFEELGPTSGVSEEVEVRVDHEWTGIVLMRPGQSHTVSIPVNRSGSIPVEIRLPQAPGELTGENNFEAFSFEGVRDRLRVLLVSGSPHPAARVWRNLLRSDPAVDLVHFVILRNANSENIVPNTELSLIEFPVRRLFIDEIHQFDLIIFDRYERRGFLPDGHVGNVVRYVREGGALLVAGGGELGGVRGFAGGQLEAIMPLVPLGSEQVSAFRPTLTSIGSRHPVTAEVASAMERSGQWYRLVKTKSRLGHTLLTGPDEFPLLALARVDQGRVGVLASEHAWLWSRGHGGGGPHRELFRRVAHWLMQEPELEEEALQVTHEGGMLTVSRRSMEELPPETRALDPEGNEAVINLRAVAPGLWKGFIPDPVPGLHLFRSGKLEALARVGREQGNEMNDVVATGERLESLVESTGGRILRVSDGIPFLRRGTKASAIPRDDELLLPRRDAFRVVDTEIRSLMPPWLAVALILCALAAAWAREAGTSIRRSP